MNQLYISKLVAFFIQLISTIIVIYALFVQIPSEYLPLKQSLAIETFVQIIQMLVYILLIIQFKLANMASTRYLDWIITTPLMLVALIIYLKYEQNVAENKSTENTLQELLDENKNDILLVLLANGLMLLLGFVGEQGYISKEFATIGGFLSLLVVFWVIYNKFASKSNIGTTVFIPFASVWSMYGVAYNFSEVSKNLTYNILDTIAKNIFGIFLSYNVLTLA